MRTLVHLSDLHFGAVDPRIVAAIGDDVTAQAPDVVAVSGDLTQRARRGQFRAARAFLDTLPAPLVVVPGNHDVPLYNIVARLTHPLWSFRRYVGFTADYLDDPEMAIVGANSTRSLTVKDGGLTAGAVHRLLRQFDKAPPDALRVVVCHHPFDQLPTRASRWTLPAPWSEAMATLVAGGVDVFLTGHLHLSYSGHTAKRYKTEGRSAVVVEAGTATSVRGRGEANAYNVLRLESDRISIERREWDPDGKGFVAASRDQFVRIETGWSPASHVEGSAIRA